MIFAFTTWEIHAARISAVTDSRFGGGGSEGSPEHQNVKFSINKILCDQNQGSWVFQPHLWTQSRINHRIIVPKYPATQPYSDHIDTAAFCT